MIRKLIAALLMVGAIYAFPYEEKSKLSPTENPFRNTENSYIPEIVPLKPENVPLTAENVPLPGGNVPLAPGNVPLHPDSFPDDTLLKDGPVATEVIGKASKDGSKLESTDLKTDATFWWPFYRSFYRYPYYRHYRPRVYYRYYYW